VVVEAPGGESAGDGPVRSARAEPSAGESAENAGVAALREYEAAYEALDIARLARIWSMNRNERRTMAALFQDAQRISLELEIQTVQVEDESVYIDFDQVVREVGQASLTGRPARMTATVIPQAAGHWVISSILPRS
jgi:hypothetical protein